MSVALRTATILIHNDVSEPHSHIPLIKTKCVGVSEYLCRDARGWVEEEGGWG